MRRALSALVVAGAVFGAAALPTPEASGAPAPSTIAQARSIGTLTVTPAAHVAGQALTFTGKLPRPGRRAIHLQFHMNRPGDRWTDVKGSDHHTTASGAYRFRFPAPSMFDISYRVVGGDLVSTPRRFYARPQAVTLAVDGADERSAVVTVGSLSRYTVVVDSAADIYTHRELEPPVFAGRVVTLQERTSDGQWRTIGTARADERGLASFDLTASLLGERVLRAKVGDVTAAGSDIGWSVSWPTYVRSSLLPDILGAALPRPTDREPLPPETDSTGATDASTQHGWFRPTYDFAWEYGQSLSSPPTRGEVLKGGWEEYSTGSGRVVPFNALAFRAS
ncbi:hypothetical protein [Nocardioides psychrotolerans]|uniref:hypothetical protein n=1 Tax=Nocardioides psychrotolerans TaxID=1005945 RepID=UPI0031381A5A